MDNLDGGSVYLISLNNEKIRDVIDTLTSKAVLILGVSPMNGKPILDALRETLRELTYLRILFDFDKPANRDLPRPLVPWRICRALSLQILPNR